MRVAASDVRGALEQERGRAKAGAPAPVRERVRETVTGWVPALKRQETARSLARVSSRIR